MNADPRVPFGAPSASPALTSRRTRRASTQTRGNSTTLSSATLPDGPHQRRSSLQGQALQREGHPHRADSPNCLCTACHLKAAVFPRRRDGRIVLPMPWHSPGVSQPIPQLPSGGELQNHVPNVAEATRSDDNALQNWGRRSPIRNVRVERHTDRGEGGSRGVPRLSGPGVAPSEELPAAQPSHLNLSDNVETKRRRSNADRSKSYRYPKPYGRPAEQGASGPLTAGLEHFESSYRPGIDPSAVYLYHPSSLVTATQPSITEMRSRRDPYDNIGAGPSQSLDPRARMGDPTLNPSTVHSQSIPQGPLDDNGFSTLSTSTRGTHLLQHPPSDRRQAQSASLHPSQAGITSHLQPSSSLDSSWDQTRNIHFSTSSPKNLRQGTSHTAGSSHQTIFLAPTSAPSSSSFTWRPGDDEEENVIRFQEPVVHDPAIISDQQDGQVEIKWDTERKRRQGYFSQAEEGSEKSNFRLYNQSEIDFGS